MKVELLEQYLRSEKYLSAVKRKIDFFNQDFRDIYKRIEAWKNFRANIFDFLEKCVVVYEPRAKTTKEIIFLPFDYQKEVISKLENVYRNGGDLFIEKSRDLGVSYTVLAWVLHKWLFEKGFTALLGSRKEDEVDNRLQTSLFGKLRFMLYAIPKWLEPKGFRKRFHDSHMKLINPENGSVIEGESSNPNFSRGKRSSIIIADEIFFWQYAKESIKAMYDASSSRVFISTPVQDAFAKRFVENLKKQNSVYTISWEKHPFKDKEWYEQEKIKRGSISEAITSELDISYDISLEDAYYPESFSCSTKNVFYDSNYPLYIGLDTAAYKDYTAIIWAQMIDGQLIVLHSLLSHGRLMPGKNLIDWFLPFFSKKIPLNDKTYYEDWEWDLLMRVRQYDDPDIICGESNLKMAPQVIGRSWDMYLNDVFSQYGITTIIDTNDDKMEYSERRRATSLMLKKTVFNNDETAINLLDALKSTKKIISREGNKVVPKNHPGDKDLRAAFENLCCSLENKNFGFRVINYVQKNEYKMDETS
jgi:hypothetical protein